MEVVLSSEAEPQVSVVIASLAGAPFIDECLSSREGQVRRCGAETVVEACGTSEYAQRIAQKFPWIRVIHHDELRARGEKLVLAPLAVVSQHRHGLRLRAALQERYVWGRSYAATGAKLAGTGRRPFWAVFAPALSLLMLARMILMAWGKRRTLGALAEALPLIAALSLSWSCGEFIRCPTGRPHSGGETAEALVRGFGGAS
jgi:hypothetical protein